MHDNLYNKITTFTRFFTTIFVILSFIITKSKYIILFTILLTIYLLILNNEKFKKLLKQLKNYILIILVILLIIMLITDFSVQAIFKYIVIVLLINIFILNLDFKTTHSFIYKIIRNKLLSYKITLFLYYLNTIFMSKDEIKKFQEERGNYKYGLVNRFFARLEYAKYKKDRLDNNLKTSFYTPVLEKTNFISVCTFILFLFLLIMVIIRK